MDHKNAKVIMIQPGSLKSVLTEYTKSLTEACPGPPFQADQGTVYLTAPRRVTQQSH